MGVWWKRIRAVVAMGLIWAVGGIAIGGVLELLDNIAPATHPLTRLVDMWPQTLALLAFPYGVVFAIVLGALGGRRRFEEFSLRQFTTWGALAGVIVGALPLMRGAGLVFFAVTTALSALGGASSLLLARAAEGIGLLGRGKAMAALPGDRER